MTVILDTNVFVSGLIFPGKISKIIDHAQNSDFKLVFCDELKLEILNKFTLKFQVDLKTLQTINQLIQKGQFYELKRVKQLLRDPKDDFLIELLRVSKADFLISGDKDILEYKSSSDYVKKFENHGQYILKPFEFLEIIKS
jgi:putative PIN family toxin of toxin-antitoxin system